MASASASGSGDEPSPVNIIVLGMAGSGKTTFVKKLIEHLDSTGKVPYAINLDPAVYHVPYHANIDIRDTVKFKEVMKQYGFGPNGAIMTSLNFFTAHFDKVLQLITKNAKTIKHVVIDTPGQIEVFTWSASGIIITEALSASFPTLIVYVMDTPRSHNPVTFISNMLYACSVLYRMKLPFIVVLNKTDIIDCDFAIEWMRDFEAFQAALAAHRSAGGGAPGVGGDDPFDSADGPGLQEDSSQYMTSLTSSMSLVLDEFYTDLRCCGVSSVTGDGMDKFMQLVGEATDEYYKDYVPALKAKQLKNKLPEPKTLLSRSRGNDDDDGEDDDSSSPSSDEDDDTPYGRALKKGSRNPILVDMIGNEDNTESDPLVHLDGIEERPDEVDNELDDKNFHERCSITSKSSVPKD